MSDNYTQQATYFKALSHPARLHILALLRQGEACVCHLEAATGKRQAYISQQLMTLRDAGLIDSRKEGRMMYYRISDPHVLRLLDATLDPLPADVETISGCTCPHCSTQLIQID